MSNPEEKITNSEEEIIEQNSDDSDNAWSDLEEGEIRELVFALPALRVGENISVVEEELRKQAVMAARLVLAAAREAEAMRGIVVEPAVGECLKKKKVGRPKKVRFYDLMATSGASGSSEEGETVKKPRKKGSSILTNPPEGPPMCNVCGKGFLSWKGVFGHLRLHKDRGYLGFLPPPTFNAAGQGVSVDGASSSSGGRGVGLGVGGIGIDLNVDLVEKEEEEATGSGSAPAPAPAPKIDLNRSPPNEDEEEEEGDKAE